MAGLDRRQVVKLAAAGAATAAAGVTLGPLVTAHQADATPEASLLAALDLPVLDLAISDEALDLPAEFQAGTVLLRASNTGSAPAYLLFVQLAEGVTEADIDAALAPDSAQPDWLHECVVTGSVEAVPGAVAEVAFTLSPGLWYVVDLAGARYVNLTATGDLVEVPIEADVEVVMSHHRFEIKNEVPAGTSLWQVTNEDPVIHHMMIFSYPEAIDEEQFLGLLMASEGMGEAPEGLDPALVAFVTGTGDMSQGESNWNQFSFEPGHYQATCFIADPGAELPHAAAGMIAVFDVA